MATKAKPRSASLPVRLARLHAKLIAAIILGLAVAWLSHFDLRPTRLLTGWNAGIALYLCLTQFAIWRADVAHIRRRAAEQDEGAAAILTLTIAATAASMVAVVFLLGNAEQETGGQAVATTLFAMGTILLSWAFVHTIFALHYAHEYYGERGDGKMGGLSFPGDKAPDYWDFLYFSLVIGMTSQVSDVAVTSHVIRRLVAIHGVMSFFFNLTVLALTVNMLSNLI